MIFYGMILIHKEHMFGPPIGGPVLTTDTAIAVSRLSFSFEKAESVIVCFRLAQSNYIAYAILYANPCSLYVFL